ncbi:MAG: hypothetical protein NW215_01375 [Hyphomicrobiales bacterium]|nr:hypothetical protein [Hyphomicrobiales bacterium]
MGSRDDHHGGARDAAAHEARARRQRVRSIAIALALVGVVILFYAVTIVRLGGNVLNRGI